MNKKKNITQLLFAIAFLFPNLATGQVTMDLELLGGMTFNGNNNDYSDDDYSFELKNGVSYGLGFDIWSQKIIPCPSGTDRFNQIRAIRLTFLTDLS